MDPSSQLDQVLLGTTPIMDGNPWLRSRKNGQETTTHRQSDPSRATTSNMHTSAPGPLPPAISSPESLPSTILMRTVARFLIRLTGNPPRLQRKSSRMPPLMPPLPPCDFDMAKEISRMLFLLAPLVFSATSLSRNAP